MAYIPTILEAGRADGILIKTDSIYDDNKKIFLSDELEKIDNNHNTLNDTVYSLINTVNDNKSNIDTKLQEEITRATKVELALDAKLETEKNRAVETENNLIETINNITEVNKNATSANIVTIDPLLNSTASNVQQALDPLYKNSLYAGIATPDTNPGIPDNPIFYITTKAGTYTNFSNIEVIEGETAILQWNNNEWIKKTTGIATEQEMIYDVSARNNNIVFESLQALLTSSNLNILIPTSVRNEGMNIRFIQGSEQSSDNKYVQYVYINTNIIDANFKNTINWQKINLETELISLQNEIINTEVYSNTLTFSTSSSTNNIKEVKYPNTKYKIKTSNASLESYNIAIFSYNGNSYTQLPERIKQTSDCEFTTLNDTKYIVLQYSKDLTIDITIIYNGLAEDINIINNNLIQINNNVSILQTKVNQNKIRGFNKVADMISASLIVGEYAQTCGYYAIGDGGAANYKIIANSTSLDFNSGLYILLNNGNVASLVLEKTMSAKQFGAKSDGITDDTDAIQNAMNNAKNIIIPDNCLVVGKENWGAALYPKSDTTITFNGTLKFNTITENPCSCIKIYKQKNISLINPNIVSLVDEDSYWEHSHGILIIMTEDIKLFNAKIFGFHGDGINISYDSKSYDENKNFIGSEPCYNRRFYADYIFVSYCYRNAVTVECCQDLYIGQLVAYHIETLDPSSAIDIEQDAENLQILDLHINKIISHACPKGINITPNLNANTFIRATIDNANIYNGTVTIQGNYTTIGHIRIGNLYINNSNNIITYNTRSDNQLISKEIDYALSLNVSKVNIFIDTLYLFNIKTTNKTIQVVLYKDSYYKIAFLYASSIISNALYVIQGVLSDNKVHCDFYGSTIKANAVNQKNAVNWLNDFENKLYGLNHDAPIITINSEINFDNLINNTTITAESWNNAVRTLKVGDNGSIPLPSNMGGGNISTKGSWIKYKFKNESGTLTAEALDAFILP